MPDHVPVPDDRRDGPASEGTAVEPLGEVPPVVDRVGQGGQEAECVAVIGIDGQRLLGSRAHERYLRVGRRDAHDVRRVMVVSQRAVSGRVRRIDGQCLLEACPRLRHALLR